MPRWWKDEQPYQFVMDLDETLEATGVTPELKTLLVQWSAELARLRADAGTPEARVEVSESGG